MTHSEQLVNTIEVEFLQFVDVDQASIEQHQPVAYSLHATCEAHVRLHVKLQNRARVTEMSIRVLFMFTHHSISVCVDTHYRCYLHFTAQLIRRKWIYNTNSVW